MQLNLFNLTIKSRVRLNGRLTSNNITNIAEHNRWPTNQQVACHHCNANGASNWLSQ